MSSWEACVFSALAGASLTLLAGELRHRRRRRISPTATAAVVACGEDVTENNGVDKTDRGEADAASDSDGDDHQSDSGQQQRQRQRQAGVDINNSGPNNSQLEQDSANTGVDYLPRQQPRRRNRRASSRTRPSFSGSFNDVDGEKRNSIRTNSFNDVDGEKRNSFASVARSSVSDLSSSLRIAQDIKEADIDAEPYAKTAGTNVVVLSEGGVFSDDRAVVEAQEFDDHVVSKLKTLDDSKLLLHRTRAVSALASRLMAAPDEESCYDVASRLLVPLFCVDRCSYVLLKDADHIIIKGVAVKNRKHATKLGLEGKKHGGVVKPINGTMVGKVRDTLQQQYCPRTKGSKLEIQRQMHSVGINSILATPILVNGNKFAGCIIISMMKEDAFREYDRILIQDIASMLGANIYAKRMRRAAENSNKISREMLHSMIPAKVIEKIEVFWDENSDEYMSRRSSNAASLALDSIYDSSEEESSGDESKGSSCSNNGNDKEEDTTTRTTTTTTSKMKVPKLRRCKSVDKKINFLNQMNTMGGDSDGDNDNAGIIVDTSSMEIGNSARALYAENVKDVCIIFTDIVGFSKLALDMKPLEVVDMLQALFSRFDMLCDKHGVTKLETIGDAYICTTNLFDEEIHGGNAKEAAKSALEMAKDMVLATQEVVLPGRMWKNRKSLFEHIEIRVGIHIGEVTCGVLGERLPKFTVFGHNVNLAARMEQSSKPSKIRASATFHDLVSDGADKDAWDECEIVNMKNMGDVGTYILDPSDCRNDDTIDLTHSSEEET